MTVRLPGCRLRWQVWRTRAPAAGRPRARDLRPAHVLGRNPRQRHTMTATERQGAGTPHAAAPPAVRPPAAEQPDLRRIYRLMLVARATDERMWILSRQGKAGFVLT